MDSEHNDAGVVHENTQIMPAVEHMPNDANMSENKRQLKKQLPHSSPSSSEASSEENGAQTLQKEPNLEKQSSSLSSSSSETSLEEDELHMPEDEPKLKKPTSSSSSSSSSSSEAYSEESFFQLDTGVLSSPMTGNNPFLSGNENPTHGENERFETTWSPWSGQPQTAASPFACVPDCSPGSDGCSTFRATQAPSVQMMAKPDPFDPNRIPSSIFRTKSTTPNEWSINSNESLFSIHIGRSGDLTGLFNGQFDYLYGSPLHGSETATAITAEQDVKLPAAHETSHANAVEGNPGANFEGHSAKDQLMTETSHSDDTAAHSDGSMSSKSKPKSVTFRSDRVSNGSASSDYSFAFPMYELTDTSQKGNSLYQPLRKGHQQASAPQVESPKAATPSVAKRKWSPRHSWFPCSWHSCCSCYLCF